MPKLFYTKTEFKEDNKGDGVVVRKTVTTTVVKKHVVLDDQQVKKRVMFFKLFIFLLNFVLVLKLIRMFVFCSVFVVLSKSFPTISYSLAS